ncbi:MAG: 4-(cytidine 5'-diphospho)-2-C-methyl-D-erythritol kinase [Gammaproteobacteria bacterium 39-13]|nr:4-(cytidine 5'-diphospho)-2-C-methyl-D-erythritol kinase [Gammaproteobacteria bacterium]OJV89815.1 MAG: 4-(cytidine 5'-diphospho)-2-C-methyl-D-erythritol kinase [Gammaproteobacteria bacterium 39-13]
MHCSLPSPAKINRFLHIVGRRQDGYHLLQTLFQYLDYGDMLHFELRNDNHIVLNPRDALGIPQTENLIYRAAEALRKAAQIEKGVTIHWEKQLPLGAGLGGGSSNAATCLFALNWLWQLNWSRQQLMDLGTSLGADIPFFLYGHTAWGEGIGELLTTVSLPESWILVVVPQCQVVSAKMYAQTDLTRNTPTLRIEALVRDETDLDLNGLRNDFEPVVRRLFPEVDNALKWLSNYGEARLSGSGASVFASFASFAEAKEVASRLPKPYKAFIAKGLNKSPLLLAAESLGIKYSPSECKD